MPEIKISNKQKTAKEQLREIRDQQKAKKAGGKKLTIADLETRLEALEGTVLNHES